eukprot:CAMPEP_0184493762 /NCGR_PEP_ID=MMETSP0113_2-20130426/26878_1 /TAXON_ID=91329 /ORGANISM="Norrisiella sphaerica, Strain BC52" /LENGTH=93 /DNA_ID=CAMNT_0026879165 /DNA_START=517 /DNA_END=795 /DNA_ORIENTATION=-
MAPRREFHPCGDEGVLELTARNAGGVNFAFGFLFDGPLVFVFASASAFDQSSISEEVDEEEGDKCPTAISMAPLVCFVPVWSPDTVGLILRMT